MSKQQGQNPGAVDETEKMVWISVFVLILLLFLFASQRERLVALLGVISWIHILPYVLLSDAFPWLREAPVLGSWIFEPATKVADFLARGGFASMTTEQLNLVLTAGGRAAMPIYLPIMILLIRKGMTYRVDEVFRMRHSLDSMIALQASHWSTTSQMVRLNPQKLGEIDAASIANGVEKQLSKVRSAGQLVRGEVINVVPSEWNRALAPEEYLVSNGITYNHDRHRALKEERAHVREFEFRENWEQVSMGSLTELLSSQLRTPWRGPEKLPPLHKALFAIMALFRDYKIDDGNALISDLGALAGTTSGKRGEMTAALVAEEGLMARIDKIIAKHSADLVKIGKGHAWVESAFPVFMAKAREKRGVLAPASFLWLKADDRLMWYILHSVGVDAVCVEAAGALAHSKAEIQVGSPLVRPAVYQAVRSFHDEYLDLTEDRIRVKKGKAIATRKPEEQVRVILEDALREAAEKEKAS